MVDRRADLRAIHGIVAEQQDAFNAKDADRFGGSWRLRSWAVTSAGDEIEGRAGIVESSRDALAGPFADQRAVHEPGTVEFLGDDVAILHVYARAAAELRAGSGVGHSVVALYVFARDAGRWEIVARQDTLVRRPS